MRLSLCLFLIQLSRAQSSTPTPSPSSPPVLTQRILHPAHGDVLVPGSVFTIQWVPNPRFNNITIQLWDRTSWGYSHDLLTPCVPWKGNAFCGTIALHAPNTGSFEWLIPNPQNGTLGFGFPRGEQVFWVKIFVEDLEQTATGVTEPVVSWSQNFAFAKEGESGTTVVVDTTATIDPAPATLSGTGTTTTAGPSDARTTPAASITNTEVYLKGSTEPSSTSTSSVEGTAPRLRGSITGVLVLLLGLI